MKIGVVLSGCGVYDGSEIHESVAVLMALSAQGAEAVCLAPDADQTHVIDHLSGNPSEEKRSVLREAARIARGNIRKIDSSAVKDLDGVIFPGGYGVVKNLCTFAFDGTDCRVHPEVEKLILSLYAAGKPIGAVCIAPVLVAKVLRGKALRLTIGDEAETAAAIESLGHSHAVCDVHAVCVDKKNRVVSTPAYMLARNIGEAASGIQKLVTEVLVMAKEPAST